MMKANFGQSEKTRRSKQRKLVKDEHENTLRIFLVWCKKSSLKDLRDPNLGIKINACSFVTWSCVDEFLTE